MNDTLTSVRSPGTDRRLLAATAADGVRLTPVDRLELRIGLWLLLRSARRHEGARDRDAHIRRIRNDRARTDLHHAALRAHALDSVRT
jgi:hypothetical protein